MNEKKNVIIGKIGKSVKFKNTVVSTGDDAPMIFYSAIARMNPNYDFYFIGPNDLKKLNDEEYNLLFPAHNVYSANIRDEKSDDWYHGIIDYFKEKNITPDFALVFNGMVSNVNIPNFLTKDDGTFYKPLYCFSNYAAPYIYVFNKFKDMPVFLISEDARYITINAKDLYNHPRLIFSQINGEFETYKHIKSDTDFTYVKGDKIKAIYAGMEKIFMMGLPEDWAKNIDIERKLKSTGNKFIVLSNGCGTAKINSAGNNSSRLPTYKKWIIDNFKGTPYENTKIYGSWDKEIYDQYPEIIDRKIYDLQDEIGDAKYTLCYSQVPGFVTIKVWECVCLGLIPFIHPDYDKYRLLGMPDYLYVESPEDLKKKIDELEANPDMYRKLMQECIDKFKPSWLSGRALNNYIFGTIADMLGFTYEKSEGMKDRLIFHRFEKQVLPMDKK